MDKSDPPTSFGIFKPVGHTLMAMSDEAKLLEAVAGLTSMGFAPDSMVRYSPAEMLAQTSAELVDHNPLANFGYELDLLNVHHGLAQQGCSFLVVEAATDELAAQVATLITQIQPVAAQHYGRLMIEDLTEKPLAPASGVNAFSPEP